jgi:hypothetical protein
MKNKKFKNFYFLLIGIFFYKQGYAAEEISSFQETEKQRAQEMFAMHEQLVFLCNFERAQADYERLLAMEKDLDITDRLEKAAEGLGVLDEAGAEKNFELEQKIVFVGKQVDDLRMQVELFKAQRKKAEDAGHGQLVKDKKKNLGKSVGPLVDFWQAKYNSSFLK